MLRWFSASANALLIGALLCGSVAAEVSVAPAGKGYDIDVSGQASTTEVIDAIAAAMSPMALSFWADNRRVSNQLLCRELGYRLRFPSYREGFRASLEEERGSRLVAPG